jgi:adenosylcobinamide-GDP ribazoletransferase
MADATGRIGAGVRLALTTLTVAPVRAGRIARDVASVAMSLAPVVGAVLGAVIAAIGIGANRLGAPAVVAGSLVVAAGVLLTRGLHIDGLADTADALGSYRDRETALDIMKRPDVGAFGVAAIVLVLLTQVAAAGAIVGRAAPVALAGVVTAMAAGRLAITVGCRRGVPAARTGGLGALVAGTVGGPALAVGALAVLAVAVAAVPNRPWQGPLAVGLSLAVTVLLVHHAVRRLGGITGDVLGAACELSVTVTYVVVSLW